MWANLKMLLDFTTIRAERVDCSCFGNSTAFESKVVDKSLALASALALALLSRR